MAKPKATVISTDVLAGQGCGGSRIVSVPNPAPGQGPSGGDKALSTEVQVGPLSSNPPTPAPKAGSPNLSTDTGFNLNSTLQG